MSTLPQQPPQPPPSAPNPASGGTPPDPFDKALALSQQFVTQELAALERSNNRIVFLLRLAGGIASGLVVIFGGLLVFFGLRTISEARQSAKEEVKRQLPVIVQTEALAQFNKADVGKIIQERFNAKIDQLIVDRVAPIVTELVREQRVQLEAQIRRELSQSKPPAERSSLGQDAKTITEKQVTLLRQFLRSSSTAPSSTGPDLSYRRSFEIWVPPDDKEAELYASRIVSVLKDDSWEARVVPGQAPIPVGFRYVEKNVAYSLGNNGNHLRWIAELFRCMRAAGFVGDVDTKASKLSDQDAYITIATKPDPRPH